jgi:hypothetical protein
MSELEQEGLLRHWSREVELFTEEAEVLRGILWQRGRMENEH